MTNSKTCLSQDLLKQSKPLKYTQRQWDRVVGIGKVPSKYQYNEESENATLSSEVEQQKI
jgi:hypothetical protein